MPISFALISQNSNSLRYCNENGIKTFTEIDECAVGLHLCDVNAACVNTRGSYECACEAGYNGDGFSCTRE